MSEVANPVQKLWQDQPVEGIKMSAEEIRRRSGKFERRIRWRNIREYIASLIAAVLLGYFFATAHDVLSRVTFGLFIAALAWMMVSLYRKGSAKKLPEGVDTLTGLHFYRAELERQREVVRSVWWWYLAPMVPGFLVTTVGDMIKSPHLVTLAKVTIMDVCVLGMFVWVGKMNMKAARCLTRMIEELNGVE